MGKIFVFFLLTSLSSTSVRAMMKAKPKKDLGIVCENMWKAAGNNLKIPTELKINLDKLDSEPLFKVEPAGQTKIGSEVFTTFAALLKNNDDTSQEAFLELITQPGGPVAQAWEYLKENKILDPKQEREDFKKTLKELWFVLPLGKTSKGFVHVFTGERGQLEKDYQGFHNWYRFYLEQETIQMEKANNKVIKPDLTYNTEPSFMQGVKFKWDNAKKTGDGSSFFVGTSPAFDFAIFSACALSLFKEKDIEVCTCKIHKSELEVTARQIKIKFKKAFVATGKISTAYPSSVAADFECTSVPPNVRTNCGWAGIDDHNCGERGCCFDRQQYMYVVQAHFCFYPSDHKCHVVPSQNKVDCGSPLGITRIQCEQEKNCCFDENPAQSSPKCYQGVPKEKKLKDERGPPPI